MNIVIDDLSGELIARFLEEHIEEMRAVSPPESKHALDLQGLKAKENTFWSVYEGALLVGCGALKALDAEEAEIKSMRVLASKRNTGIASKLLIHILSVSQARGYRKISLETGSMPFFEPARKLYLKHGFEYCQPFGNYKKDANSVFMSLELARPN